MYTRVALRVCVKSRLLPSFIKEDVERLIKEGSNFGDFKVTRISIYIYTAEVGGDDCLRMALEISAFS